MPADQSALRMMAHACQGDPDDHLLRQIWPSFLDSLITLDRLRQHLQRLRDDHAAATADVRPERYLALMLAGERLDWADPAALAAEIGLAEAAIDLFERTTVADLRQAALDRFHELRGQRLEPYPAYRRYDGSYR